MNFSDLVGKTFTEIDGGISSILIEFRTKDKVYTMEHMQDCCEQVDVEDITGDMDDLIGTPILLAEEVSSSNTPVDHPDRRTDELQKWTFYKLATIKGYVTIRWYGTSNGCYSVQVSIIENDRKEEII